MSEQTKTLEETVFQHAKDCTYYDRDWTCSCKLSENEKKLMYENTKLREVIRQFSKVDNYYFRGLEKYLCFEVKNKFIGDPWDYAISILEKF